MNIFPNSKQKIQKQKEPSSSSHLLVNTKTKEEKEKEIEQQTILSKKNALDKKISEYRNNEGIYGVLNDVVKEKDKDKKVTEIVKPTLQTTIKNAIFLKIPNKPVEVDVKKHDEAKEISDKMKFTAWNIGTGITAGKPSNVINYESKNLDAKVTLMSTFGIKCGIATYTSYLLENINKYLEKENLNEPVDIFPMNDKKFIYKIKNDIIHLQHEYGIIPKGMFIEGKVIITFHSVFTHPKVMLKQFENDLDVVCYIAHSKAAAKVLRENTNKQIYIIPHGSKVIDFNHEPKSLIRKELNFDKLGINDWDKCVFIFGFQSADKNFTRILNACKNTNMKVIISGAKHECEYENASLKSGGNVILLNKFLDEKEVDMYSSACDLLIFDYISQKHYSVSGAMHRVVGAGTPVICSRINHFIDIVENEQCLKFYDQEELELKIKEALEKNEEYSKKALEFANSTSWEVSAKMHLDIYRKYMNNENVDKNVDENSNENVDEKGNVINEQYQ